MANPAIIQPDAELALIQYLRSSSAVTSVIDGAKITTALPPEYDRAQPHVLIQRTGGYSATWQSIDEPSFQIDVTGGSRHECQTVMRHIRAAVMAIANDIVAEGVLASSEEEIAPTWMPDIIPVPPVPRFTWRCRVYLHN